MISRVLLVPLLALGTTSLSAQQPRMVSREILQRAATTVRAVDSVHLVRAGADTAVSVPTANGVRIRKGDVLVVSTGHPQAADTAHGEIHVDLPNRYITLGSGSQVLTLRLRVSFLGTGFQYVPRDSTFIGHLVVGLEDTARLSERVTLGTPIEVEVTGEADTSDPTDFSISHTNLPFTRIQLRVRRPAADTVRIIVQPTFDPVGSKYPIPVQRPPVRVVLSPQNLQGFGLQTAKVTVQVTDGPAGMPVLVVPSSGKVEEDTLQLSAMGVAQTTLRSEWVGSATVHAIVGHVATGETSVEYTVPWKFGIAAFLGGLIGTPIRRKLQDEKKAKLLGDLGIGVLFGIFGAIAYAVGVNLLGWDVKVQIGEGFTLVIAGLCSALLLPGLAKLKPNKKP